MKSTILAALLCLGSVCSVVWLFIDERVSIVPDVATVAETASSLEDVSRPFVIVDGRLIAVPDVEADAEAEKMWQ